MIHTHWKPASLLKRLPVSKEMASWLSTSGSLTRKIRQACPTMQVEVLSEGWQCPLPSEARALGLSLHQKVWVRSVVLKCGHTSWVFARTVIPNPPFANPWSWLQKLGNKPLGEVLFELKNVERSDFEFSQQSVDDWPLLNRHLNQNGLIQSDKKCFARRSLFRQQQAPLLLTEVFLSPILQK
ncbi:chorismate--pyruvate lyase family protein [Thiomicrorhabdus chilensis]|uniref:chorismate--pyruvate lyase family protein n=1 Tax=Thiomicrorhabdus chilensis TaxID=63656 RepID=UPI0003F4FE0A|nr:chorismate lyase [Thiomicrorhabdus chilensis]